MLLQERNSELANNVERVEEKCLLLTKQHSLEKETLNNRCSEIQESCKQLIVR